jgi:DNA mismatch repair protein MutS
MDGGVGIMAAIEADEREKTGIRTLRVNYNRVFGYYIEISKSFVDQVPAHYIRRQTLTNNERYITPELKELEEQVLTAKERRAALEYQIFTQLREYLAAQAPRVQIAAAAIAVVDSLCSLASVAVKNNYCKPEIAIDGTLFIRDGRHPVVEQMLKNPAMGSGQIESFVPNDTHLSANARQIALITGPNMAGKSTYIRQVALIVLMAQIGSWVPASRAQIGWVDRIFSRIGASDELAHGRSTFMVEMSETANILNNATERSLVVLDEIGRGTSTYDGLSIAWAVAETLHGAAPRGPRTLFASHYHELTQLEKTLPRLRNYAVRVKEWEDRVIFLRRVEEGSADRSYGIQVAKLAGLPPELIARAAEILSLLEKEGAELQSSLRQTLAKTGRPQKRRKPPRLADNQLSLPDVYGELTAGVVKRLCCA